MQDLLKIMHFGGKVIDNEELKEYIERDKRRKSSESRFKSELVFASEVITYLKYYIGKNREGFKREIPSIVKSLSSDSPLERFSADYGLWLIYKDDRNDILRINPYKSPNSPENEAALQFWRIEATKLE